MGGIALLAREQGIGVSGADANVYPPMSTQLQEQGIVLTEGYSAARLEPAPDCVVIGNALSRGNPAVEFVLDQGLDYTSGPQWLAEHILKERWVLAVAGTHGKTTTSAMLAWILEHAGLEPGFLIGGIPANFGVSARAGRAPFFVVEADEYDTAIFDKRSKFVHYRPRTLVMNNLEYDHADIFPDIEAIRTQFHHLVRTVPGNGRIIHNADDDNLARVLARGCWSETERFTGSGPAGQWQARLLDADGSRFEVLHAGEPAGTVEWSQIGQHNVSNALAALAAARHAGVPVAQGVAALGAFQGVKRRMEVRGTVNGITVYDDFAHHPTAIATTLQGLRHKLGHAARIFVVLEPRSNTMRMGVHRDNLAAALQGADRVWLYQPPGLDWSLDLVTGALDVPVRVMDSVAALVQSLQQNAVPGDHVLIMSNGGFGGLHDRLLKALAQAGAGP